MDRLHRALLSVSDNAGNKASANRNFTLDTTLPDIRVTDTRDANPLIELLLDGANYNGLPITTEGEHMLTVTASDDITNIIPQDNTVVNSTYSISADYSDTGSGIDVDSASILIDGIDETKNALITNTSIQYKPDMQDGKHIVKLSVNDMVGNSRTVTTSFELDTTSPDVKINSPTNNSFVRQTVTISGVANDLHLGAISLEIDSIKVSGTSAYLWDTTLVKDGPHKIKLSAIDMVKNSASVSINAIVDNTPPVIQLYPVNGTEFYSDQNLRIEYNVTDATSGVAS